MKSSAYQVARLPILPGVNYSSVVHSRNQRPEPNQRVRAVAVFCRPSRAMVARMNPRSGVRDIAVLTGTEMRCAATQSRLWLQGPFREDVA